MEEEKKLYHIIKKDGTHLPDKVNADGSTTGLQFDDDNGMQGPISIVEADESEYLQTIYVESDDERDPGQALLEESVYPAVEKALEYILIRLADAGFQAVKQKVIPKIKQRALIVREKVKAKREAKKQTKAALAVAPQPAAEEPKTVRSPEEVDQIIKSMQGAALYIAMCIRELSNTVVSEDANNPERVSEARNKLKELSSAQTAVVIDFMLQDSNRELLDEASLRVCEAFRNKSFIIEGEAVPIKKYFPDYECVPESTEN